MVIDRNLSKIMVVDTHERDSWLQELCNRCGGLLSDGVEATDDTQGGCPHHRKRERPRGNGYIHVEQATEQIARSIQNIPPSNDNNRKHEKRNRRTPRVDGEVGPIKLERAQRVSHWYPAVISLEDL